jgi:RNA polymerase sigma-70 factor (ECF subfamily)
MTLVPSPNPGIEPLLRDAVGGDADALKKLLTMHRERLRRMIALRLDVRLAARVDASDIVQEALADAARKLDDYARERPLPFYPWLHRLAAERLVQAHRRHLRSQARGVGREEPATFIWPDASATLLVHRLAANDTTPGHALVREEQRQRLRVALVRLAAPDREILVMRYLEDLTFPEVAAILGIGEGAAKMRHLRALQRIRVLMGGGDGPEPGP